MSDGSSTSPTLRNGAHWRVVIHPTAMPSESHRTVPQRLRDAWKTAGISHARDGTGDFEDWVEQAERLCVAQALLPGAAWTTDLQTWRVMSTGEQVSVDVHRPAAHWGVVPSQWIVDWSAQQPAADYLASSTFHAHAGRRVALCGVRPRHGRDVRDVAADFQRLGHHQLLIKARKPKSGLWRLAATDRCLTEDVERALDWKLVTLEGQPDTLSVQEIVHMRFEYRLFVVNHELRTGAGVIECHTPIDSTSNFDDAMTSRRGDRQIVRRPDVVARYLQFAAHVTDSWRDEQPEVDTYVLDVALVDDVPVVVERNDLWNSGLYASRPQRVLEALIAQPRCATFTVPSLR